MEPITVLIVDDHPVVREGLRYMLERDERVQIVGEASNGQEALALVAELSPKVVLMDIYMPQMDGLEAARRIKAQYPTTAVIMLTMYDNDGYIIDAVRSGASGYLLKDTSRDLLRHTIAAVSSGGTLIKNALLQRALQGLAASASSLKAEYPHDKLTLREEEVLNLLTEGRSNKEIAQALCIAEDTVKKHVQSIIAKLQASDRTHAVVKAMRAGLVR